MLTNNVDSLLEREEWGRDGNPNVSGCLLTPTKVVGYYLLSKVDDTVINDRCNKSQLGHFFIAQSLDPKDSKSPMTQKSWGACPLRDCCEDRSFVAKNKWCFVWKKHKNPMVMKGIP